jgi:hypothetical protein
MPRRRTRSYLRVVFGASVIALLVAIVYWRMADWRGNAPRLVSAERIDPANEGRMLRLHGKLRYLQPPRDPQLGIDAEAVLLLRRVEMYQWTEHCSASACTYATGWSTQPIDSSRFRTPAGHENPPFPFGSTRFSAAGIQLGVFAVDAELIATQVEALDYPVRDHALPANLAASFREIGGVLYAGADPERPRVGALRVSYRIVPAGEVSLVGVQRGARLIAP